MSCTWQAESVFQPPCPAAAGDATSLRGVNLDETSVGDPEPGAVLQFDGSSYVAATSVTLPGLLGYGGESGGPQILTAESSGAFSGVDGTVVLTITPSDDTTIDLAFTLHTQTGSLTEVGIFRMYAAFFKTGGAVTMIGDADATSTKRTSGAETDGWTCAVQENGGNIEVVFTDPGDSGGNYSISAQYSVKAWP